MASQGAVGESYNIGGHNEMTNLAVVEAICDLLDRHAEPLPNGGSRRELISFVTDRPGHDFRYAIDAGKIARDLDWTPRETFESGIEKTVRWYLEHEDWWGAILNSRYDLGRVGTGARKAV